MQVSVNGEILEFPDSMSRDQIKQAIDRRYAPKQPEQKTTGSGVNQQQLAQMLSDQGMTAPQQAQQPESRIMPMGDALLAEAKQTLRAPGLLARSGLNSIDSAINLFGAPVVYGLSKFGIDPRGGGNYIADKIGLPKPETSTERIVSDVAGPVMMTGGAIALANKVAQAGPAITAAQRAAHPAQTAAQEIAQRMAARPDLQLASATTGATAGAVVKENGGGPLDQFVATILGGIAGPFALTGSQKMLETGKSLINTQAQKQQVSQQIDQMITLALKERGQQVSDIPQGVYNQIHQDMQKYISTGQLTPDVVRRLVDYKTVSNMAGQQVKPTAGTLTLDPGTVTRQKNLQKIGMNSNDPRLWELGNIENQNNAGMVRAINNAGAANAGDKLSHGETIISSLDDIINTEKANIDNLYTAAKDSAGRSAALDHVKFTQSAGDLLNKNLLTSQLPTDIKNTLNDIATGKTPLTVDVAEQLKTIMGQVQRSSTDGNVRRAVGLVRQALDDAPLQPGQNIGREAIDNFNKARAANRIWMNKIETNPALKAVVDGVDPDKFITDFVIANNKNSTVNKLSQLTQLLKDKPEALQSIKTSLAQHLKTKALNGAADEAKFSQSAYNKALNDIGDRKLALFFNKEELAGLKALGRVAFAEQYQPAGSAVNNSNTASSLFTSLLDRIANSAIVKSLPLGESIAATPARNLSTRLQLKQIEKLPVPKQANGAPFPAVLVPFLSTYSTRDSGNDNKRNENP